MRKRKYLSAALMICMLLSMLPSELWAEEKIQSFQESQIAGDEELMEVADEGEIPLSGSCGTGLTWEFEESSGALHISGTGDMDNYDELNHVPWEAYKDQITTVVIDEGVLSIGREAFFGCDLLSLNIPGSVTSIGEKAFAENTNLEELVIPNTVTSVGNEAFAQCAIRTLTLPNGISFGDEAPFGDNPLDKVVLTGTGIIEQGILDVISSGAAEDDKKQELVISNGITGIGEDAFMGGGSFSRIEIPDSVTTIGKRAFRMAGSIDSIILPDSITSIGEDAFNECGGLTQIHIPQNLTTIEKGTFEGCFGLTSIEIPEKVTHIGNSAFASCTGLTEIIIPNQVETIDDYAFSNCTDLEKIVILDNVTDFGEKVFDKSNDVTIHGYSDSEAEEYAKANNIPFMALTQPEEPGPDEPEDPSDEWNLSHCTITLGEEKYVYDGTPKKPEVTVENDGDILTEDEDYVLIYGNNTNGGIALVTVIGMGDYAGAVKKTFSIEPKSIDDLKINYFTEVNYRGVEVRPGVSITYGQLTLKNLTDYVLNYENNKEVGNATVIITGTGNYKGEKRLPYAITPKPMSTTLARLDVYNFLSDGKEKRPEVIVMNGRDKLVENQDYTLTYVNNIKPGVGMAVLDGIGNFTGTMQLKFTIRIATPVFKSVENTPSGTKISWKKVSQADGYKLFCRVKGDGKWEIVANLKGTSYTDKKAKSNGKTYQYKVYALSDSVLSNPSGIRTNCYLSGPTITGAKSGKPGQITVKWKMNKKAEGYQIQYATKKDFSDGRKVNVSGGKSVKKTISKLKKNKKYYIRLRSYVRSSGEYFSPWSKKIRINAAG